MVNSSWTEDHINSIWKCPLKTYRVYPPCDVEHLTKLSLLSAEEKNGIIKIVSVGQFRPEKDHPLQLRALYVLRSIVSEDLWEKVNTESLFYLRNQFPCKSQEYLLRRFAWYS